MIRRTPVPTLTDTLFPYTTLFGSPIVTTFATAIVFSGVALWILPQAGGSVPESYWRGYAGDVFGLRLSVWIIAAALAVVLLIARTVRSEEHTSELQSLMRLSYDVFCLKKTTITCNIYSTNHR